ncbi:hypothetical protein CTAYLR_009269 [Chrysophaeum taylorii]|uniref:Fungal lipase-type domain-containing protein n=1 Tax=Chrysophaeum taylorii TaxID=2483200 RepID=A0AAD7UIF1_9STRA|nr:hypothetical protein CTAYLR_009269 [Chrysophaeum taylorii]
MALHYSLVEAVGTIMEVSETVRQAPAVSELLVLRAYEQGGEVGTSVVIPQEQAEFARCCWRIVRSGVAKTKIDNTKVVAVRGPREVSALVDVAREFLVPGTRAHRGLADAADELVADLDLDEEELVLTGYSWGAGVALLAAMRLRQDGKKVRAVAFSPPPVVTQIGSAELPHLESYYVDQDVVPHLSRRSVLTLLAEIKAIKAGPLPAYATRLAVVLFPLASAGGFLDLLGSRRKRRGDFPPGRDRVNATIARVGAEALAEAPKDPNAPLLKVPGALYKLVQDKCYRITMDDRIPRIRVGDRLLLDHAETALDDALETLVETAKQDALLLVDI